MSTDKMRDEFDAWARDNAMLLFVKVATGKYSSEKTELAWQAWQASRAALVIELPPQWYDAREDGDIMDANAVIAAIEAAGVRVKE